MTSDPHNQLLHRLLGQLKLEPSLIGVMLQGSVARGDHYPGSDLDLLVLVEEGHSRGLESEQIDSILVERHYLDLTSLQAKLEKRPTLTYGVVNGQILHDPQHELTTIVEYAKNLLASYTTPPQEMEDITYWLYTTRIKLKAARAAGDELKTAYLATTNAWKILEGIWAINNLPMPTSSSVLTNVAELPEQPDDLTSQLHHLFLGTPRQRVASSLNLIDWVLDRTPTKPS